MIKYGLDWGNRSSADIELQCYRFNKMYSEKGGMLDSEYDHFIRAIDELYVIPFKNLPYDDRPLIWNTWTEEHAHIWVYDDFATIWGPAAASKSHSFGMFSVVDFIAAPKKTCIFVCSTSKSMLEKRIWYSVKHYHALHAGSIPGVLVSSKTGIINKGDDENNAKAGIHGIAVRQGSEEDARSNIQGVHLPFVRLIVDEMQSTRRAAVEARANLSKGCLDFKFFGLANPNSLFDLSGEFSEPVDGWRSITPDTHKWKTKWGMTYHFDGLKSPAVLEEGGEEKYPFLINQKQIDKDIKEYGDIDHPSIWTFVRGFPPSHNEYDHVMSEAMIARYSMRDAVVWKHGFITIAGLDPAFSSGGDKCILQPARIGMDIDDMLIIEFQKAYNIVIKASDPEPPIYQVANKVLEIAPQIGLSLNHLTVDESASQSAGAVIEKESGLDLKVHTVAFNNKPSDKKVHVDTDKLGTEKYVNLVTEIWFAMNEFGRYGHIRGLPIDVARQISMRKVEHTTPVRLESKLDMKKRLKHSPDEADAACLCLCQAKMILGLVPGLNRDVVDRPKNTQSNASLTKQQKEVIAQSGIGSYTESNNQSESKDYGEW